MRNLIDIMDLTVEEIDGLIEVAADIVKNPDKYSEKCKNKVKRPESIGRKEETP